jgi:parallel beta-helix repeat protein
MEWMECNMKLKMKMNFFKVLMALILTLLVCYGTITPITASTNNEYYVDSGYKGYSDGTAQQPYKSIQTAIDMAEEGDTIYVFGGRYDELITIDKRLTLWGGVEGSDSILESKDDSRRETMIITADHVKVQDFSFTDEQQYKSSPIGSLVSVQAENVVITSNHFFETESYGIHIRSSASGTVVSGNTIYNAKHGIVVESSDTNDIFNNEIYSCSDTGIHLENTLGNRLYDNTIYACSKAIHGQYCTSLNISNNTLYENTYASMLLESSQQVMIRHNDVSDNEGTGLYLQSDYCTVRNNEFKSNQRGITIAGNHNTIQRNQFESNTGSGIFALSTSKQNTIYNNTFEENGKNAEDNGNNHWYIENIGNYWDDYNWIDLDKDGIGDISYEKNRIVDIYPLGFFLQPPDKPSNPSPKDMDTGVGLKLTLRIKVVDVDSDSIDVTFYNAENDEQIGQQKRISSEKFASCELVLPFNTTYAWYAIADDGIQQNRSDTFFFTTMITPPDNEPPVADAGGPYSGPAGEPIMFDASESYDRDGTIDFYRWNFGDKTSELLAKQPTHTYEEEGIYTVTLTVIDNLGATDSEMFSVAIGVDPNQRPTSDPGGPYQASIGESILFDGTASLDTDGDIVEYIWDFGDDTTGSGATISHSYSEDGAYLVTLTVTDNHGDSDAETTTVSIAALEEDDTPGFELVFIFLGMIFFIIKRYKKQ